MKKILFTLLGLAILSGVLALFFVLKSENALLIHPKGVMAREELNLIVINVLLMLIIIIPTFIFLFIAVKNHRRKKIASQHFFKSRGKFRELILWAIPSIVIAVMVVITWKATHSLDPFKPLKNGVKPLTIQVVALDWKWLFLYPEQGIAAVNLVQFPESTPIHFELTADGSPMNSFWIPELSGQIYAMSGMLTQLHMMADGPGVYTGRAAEINGKGFADMTFIVQSTARSDFDAWVEHVKQSPLKLTESVYNELVKPSTAHPITLYSHVPSALFTKIIEKPMRS